MKILFVGCGDIGIRVTRAIPDSELRFNCQIQAMRRNPSALPVGIDAIKGDLCNSNDLLAVLDKSNIDVIIVTLTADDMSDQGYLDSYVAGAKALKIAVTSTIHPPSLVIWISSTGVYGQTGGEWVDELSEVAPRSFRGKRLVQAEQLVSSLSKSRAVDPNSSIKSTVIRFSGIYGPGRNRLINQIRQGNIAPKDPVAWTNRIHSEDCAGVIVHLLEQHSQGKPLGSLYLATDDEPASAHKMQNWLAGELELNFSAKDKDKKNKQTGIFSNRRCSNKLLKKSGYKFLFPTFREGYRLLLKE